MRKKFEINQGKIMGGCQSGRKVVTNNSKSDLPLMNKYKTHYDIYKKPLSNKLQMIKESNTIKIKLTDEIHKSTSTLIYVGVASVCVMHYRIHIYLSFAPRNEYEKSKT